jgi:hypothetical protein
MARPAAVPIIATKTSALRKASIWRVIVLVLLLGGFLGVS